MRRAIEDLIEISHHVARHPAWVQGGGGNCSVKADGKMAIKASGWCLEELSEDEGFVVVDLATDKVVSPGAGRPSLESPLHTLLGTFTIHTHPIAVGALVCAKEGRRKFREIFPQPEYVWVDYANPGKPLYEKVKAALAREKQKTDVRILFLENHGLFVSAPTKEECRRRHDQVILKCQDYFEYLADSLSHDKTPHYLTPDHVVYSNLGKDLSPRQREAAQELAIFSQEVLAMIRAKGWTPQFLKPGDVDTLLNMEEEKYRQKLWKKP